MKIRCKKLLAVFLLSVVLSLTLRAAQYEHYLKALIDQADAKQFRTSLITPHSRNEILENIHSLQNQLNETSMNDVKVDNRLLQQKIATTQKLITQYYNLANNTHSIALVKELLEHAHNTRTTLEELDATIISDTHKRILFKGSVQTFLGSIAGLWSMLMVYALASRLGYANYDVGRMLRELREEIFFTGPFGPGGNNFEKGFRIEPVLFTLFCVATPCAFLATPLLLRKGYNNIKIGHNYRKHIRTKLENINKIILHLEEVLQRCSPLTSNSLPQL